MHCWLYTWPIHHSYWCYQNKLFTRQKKIKFNTTKLVHKALYKEGFPDYLKLELTSNIRTLRSNTETRITPFGLKDSFTYQGPTMLNVLSENIKKLDSEKRLFLQLNSISSIKLKLMRHKLLINLAFIFSPLLLNLNEFNQQIVYINFVYDLLTCDLWQQRFLFSCFLFLCLAIYTFQLNFTLNVSTL